MNDYTPCFTSNSSYRARGLTASTIFSTNVRSSTMTFNVHAPVTPSLINFVSSSMGGSSREGDGDDKSDEEDFLRIFETDLIQEFEDDTCRELWRAFRDEAGPWMSHRFSLGEWDVPKKGISLKQEEKKDGTALDSFDGILTKALIAPNLSMVYSSPEVFQYTYTKCILTRMRLTDIDALKGYRYLQYVVVSSNRLTSLKPLGNLPFLKYLDASHNFLGTILDFKAPFFLTIVNLSHNRIKVMGDLSDFWSITDLNLSHNLIRTINGIQNLRYLSTLNISFNRIEAIENLGSLRIQFLFLQNNAIKLGEEDEKAELHTLKNIRTVNLSHNQVSSLKLFEAVENLESLEIVDNDISRLLDIYYLRKLKYLNTLNLTGNPVTNIKRYSEVCITYIENLTMLNAEPVDSDHWLKYISTQSSDVNLAAAHNRLALSVLEQLNPPQIWSWLLPFDYPPVPIIVLVGLPASGRNYISRKFCAENKNVVMGVHHTTKPRHADEIQGEHYYYVDKETFMTMLKKGEFLTYQENLGSYYGIAHSEFKKADNSILIFDTDLTMALVIKTKFFNTVLALALPSTREKHLERIRLLYAAEFIDEGTLKIVNSPVLASEYHRGFAKQREELLTKVAQATLNSMITDICKLSEEGTRSLEDEPVTLETSSRKSSGAYSGKSDLSDNFKIWWTSKSHNALSILIHPVKLTSSLFVNKGSISGDSTGGRQSRLDSVFCTAQMRKFISFTTAEIHKLEGYEPSTFEEEDNLYTIPAVRSELEQYSGYSKQKIEEEEALRVLKSTTSGEQHKTTNECRKSSVYITTPFSSKKMLEENECYSDVLLQDIRMKSVFDEELKQREELLDLHLHVPGLFREMLFTDHEEQTMAKLKDLVRDISKYIEITTKATLNFQNDPNFLRVTRDKMADCFAELKRDSSLPREKVVRDYKGRYPPHICLTSICNNPKCPAF